MATVTSFETLSHPTKSELRQFAELFAPLFQASTEEAKRDAVAALSRCETVPKAVASFVACQPIAIAAPFLAASPCLDDDLLIMVARSQGAAHARAIVSRDNLSPTVIDALVSLRHDVSKRPVKTVGAGVPKQAAAPVAAKAEERPRQAEERRGLMAPLPVDQPRAAGGQAALPNPALGDQPDATPGAARAPEQGASAAGAGDGAEALRARLRRLANHINRPAGDRLGLVTASPLQAALLVRFARTREAHHFATTLTDILSASRWLSERIMLDLSGRQLAVTLTGVGLPHEDAIAVLCGLYPHLGKKAGGVLRAEMLLVELDPAECYDRIEAWLRADGYTFGRSHSEPEPVPADPIAATAEAYRRPAAARAGERPSFERVQHSRRGR